MTGIYVKDEHTNTPVPDALVEFFDSADINAGWITDTNGYVTHGLPGCFILGCVGDWSGKVRISKAGYTTKTIFTIPEGTVFISPSSSSIWLLVAIPLGIGLVYLLTRKK